MPFHLIGTAIHAGETIFHAASGNGPAAFAGLVKTGASVIPGGGIVAHALVGKVTDEIIVNGNTELAENVGRAAWNNKEDIYDSMCSAVDQFGDCDGVAEVSDIVEGLGNFFS